MTTPEPPPEGGAPRAGGAHRAEAQSTSLLLPVLGVLAVLAALGLAGYMLMTSNDDEPDAGAGPTATTSAPSVSPTAPPSDSASPTKQPTKEPTTEPTKEPTKKPDKEPTSEPVPSIGVYVFNQTGITGLAAETAAELEAAGWDVVGVDNWIGFVPEDTVYYYEGGKAAAERLSNDFPGIARVWPASSPMPGNALTVILADTTRK